MSNQSIEARLNAVLFLSVIAVSLLGGLVLGNSVETEVFYSVVSFCVVTSGMLLFRLAQSSDIGAPVDS
jgi:hypothetical protein